MTQAEILIIAKDQASGTMVKIASSALNLDKVLANVASQAEGASKRMDKIGGSAASAADKIDRAGRNARIGLSSAAQAADLLGVNISGVVGPAASAADAIGDMVGAASSLGLIGSAIGVAVVALGAFVAHSTAMRDELAETIRTTDDYFQAMDQIAASSTKAAEQLKQLSIELANQKNWLSQVIDRGITDINELAAALGLLDTGLTTSADRARELQISLQDTREAMHNLRADSDAAAMSALEYAAAENQRKLALEYSTAAAIALANALGDTRGEAIQGLRDDARSLSKMRTDAFFTKMEFKEGVGWVERMAPALKSAQSAAEKLWNTLKGLVEGALAPTSVTDEDNAATALGKYVDKWDEFRRRLEAVAGGTDPAQFGAQFSEMFAQLGMGAAEAAAAFKDFSLFADPKNLKLIDFGPIIAQVEHELQSMAGKANVVAEAMKQVWANLSPESKAALKAQGIENAGDAIMELTDPAQSAKNKVLELNDAILSVPTARTTTFTITQASNWDEVLEDILKDIAKIPTDIGINVHLDNALPPTVDGEGTYGGGPYMDLPPLNPPSGPGNPNTPSFAGGNNTNNNYGNNRNTYNLYGVQNTNQLYREMRRRYGRGAALRAAQGL